MAALITLLNTQHYTRASIQTKKLLTAFRPQKMPFFAIYNIPVYLENKEYRQGMAGCLSWISPRLLSVVETESINLATIKYI